jgi:hypothetical protein
VTHVFRLFTDKSCIKVLQNASQNTRYKIVTSSPNDLCIDDDPIEDDVSTKYFQGTFGHHYKKDGQKDRLPCKNIIET